MGFNSTLSTIRLYNAFKKLQFLQKTDISKKYYNVENTKSEKVELEKKTIRTKYTTQHETINPNK